MPQSTVHIHAETRHRLTEISSFCVSDFSNSIAASAPNRADAFGLIKTGDCDRYGDMISVQKCVINFEGNEVSEASKMSNLTGGKTETNLPNQLEVIFCQDLNGSLDGVGSADVCDYTCHNDGRFGEVSQL